MITGIPAAGTDGRVSFTVTVPTNLTPGAHTLVLTSGTGEVRLAVTVLADGPSRFGELRARVGGVTPKVLTQTLRSMERDGLVTRTQLPGVPPRVDYELTDLGRSLQAPIDALRTWIHTHSAQILAHRESYDAVES